MQQAISYKKKKNYYISFFENCFRINNRAKHTRTIVEYLPDIAAKSISQYEASKVDLISLSFY